MSDTTLNATQLAAIDTLRTVWHKYDQLCMASPEDVANARNWARMVGVPDAVIEKVTK